MNDSDQFQQFVSEAIDHIPKPYNERLDTVVFVVEDEPTEQQRKALGLRRCDALFGLYEGVPLTKRGGATHSLVPDKITIFKHPMQELFQDASSLRKQIFETVWHEVAHYYGLNHTQIDALKQHET